MKRLIILYFLLAALLALLGCLMYIQRGPAESRELPSVLNLKGHVYDVYANTIVHSDTCPCRHIVRKSPIAPSRPSSSGKEE